MFKRTLITTAVAGATVALTAVVGTGTAYAADSSVIVAGSANPAGEMKHVDNGDKFRVYDHDADNHGVRGILFDANYKVLKTSYNGLGAHDGYTEFGYDIVAGKTYYMRVCRVESSQDTTGRCNDKKVTE